LDGENKKKSFYSFSYFQVDQFLLIHNKCYSYNNYLSLYNLLSEINESLRLPYFSER
jgi:hypothetical protein